MAGPVLNQEQKEFADYAQAWLSENAPPPIILSEAVDTLRSISYNPDGPWEATLPQCLTPLRVWCVED